MTPILGHAIDVSHWQSQVPAAPATQGVETCIVRAAYGPQRDRRVTQHLARARTMYQYLGLYYFLRLGQSLEAQLRAWYEATIESGFTALPTERMVAPILDVESERGHALTPEDLATIVAALDGLELDLDTRPILYINGWDWGQLGRPEALLQWPWWWAQYSGRDLAAPPEADVCMWQHRVTPWEGPREEPNYRPARGAIDQSLILAPLPRYC